MDGIMGASTSPTTGRSDIYGTVTARRAQRNSTRPGILPRVRHQAPRRRTWFSATALSSQLIVSGCGVMKRRAGLFRSPSPPPDASSLYLLSFLPSSPELGGNLRPTFPTRIIVSDPVLLARPSKLVLAKFPP